MEFRNGLTMDDITHADVVAYILLADNVQPIADCKTFVKDGITHIDFIPRFDGEHSAPIPDDAMIAKSDDGEIGVFIHRNSPAGRLALTLAAMKRRTAHEDN